MSPSKAFRCAGLILAVAGMFFVIRVAVRHADELPHLRWSAASVAAGCASLGLYGAILLSSALAWAVLLRSLGEPSRLRFAVPTYLLAQAGKYVPGNLGHYAGRLALARAAGLGAGAIVASLLLEAAGSVLAGALIAAGGAKGQLARIHLPTAAALAVAAAALSGAALVWAWRSRRRLGLPPLPRPTAPRLAAWLVALGLYASNFMLFGLAGSLLARLLLSAPPLPLRQLTATLAAAWLAGFLTPAAPAGLGAREAVLVGALSPACGPGPALALTALFRLLTTVGDALAFLAGLVLRRRLASDPAPA